MWSGAFVYTPDDEADAFPLLMDDEVDAMDLGDLNHPYDAIMPDLPFPEQVRRRPSREDRSRPGIAGRLTASVRLPMAVRLPPRGQRGLRPRLGVGAERNGRRW